MKITKQELIDMNACIEGLKRFIEQTNNTEELINVVSLVGGKNSYSDLVWLLLEKEPSGVIIEFMVEYCLLNINLLEDYGEDCNLILNYLQRPYTISPFKVLTVLGHISRDLKSKGTSPDAYSHIQYPYKSYHSPEYYFAITIIRVIEALPCCISSTQPKKHYIERCFKYFPYKQTKDLDNLFIKLFNRV